MLKQKWSDKYIGLPFKQNGRDSYGVDCYGLVFLIYKELHNIDLLPYLDVYTGKNPETYLKIAEAMTKERQNWLTADSVNAFDMLQLRTGRHAFHVGIAIDSKSFLHVEQGIDATIERLDSPLWSNRLEWIYTHKCLK